jgi:peptidoglycan/xylan/chitin deacetylase (PgdA/CDA1 family)
LLARGAELAVHAWSHTDLTALDRKTQSEHMGRALDLFREHGIPFTGFRAPYLHWNEDTMRVVEDYKFRYSSNQAVLWNVLDTAALSAVQRSGFEHGKAFYHPLDADAATVLPQRRRGFVEIPVSLPDDEILFDRMYIHDADRLGELWRKILDETYRRGELFTLQLHPERIDFFAGALQGLLAEARGRKPGVWIATLDAIAEWWADKTGNRVDLTREGGNHRASIKACRGATVFLRADGAERIVEPGSIVIEGAVRPCAAVSPESNRDAVQALADRGFVVEIAGPEKGHAVHLGHLGDARSETLRACVAKLDACRGPLIRFGTWPHGARSALSVTGDIDAITVWDFFHRFHGA